jgi:ABC-type iron transport system FetAB ATPase subunit
MSRLCLKYFQYHTYGPISLAAEPEHILCVSGASGTGKTLLLRAIADLDAHRGTVSLDDVPCSEFSPPVWRRKVGLLTAESHWWCDTVGEHFTSADTILLSRLGFEPEVMEWTIKRLSTGERQRLALYRLLCNSPDVLLLDEPTACLDTKNVRSVEELICSYTQDHQCPVVWVSHDPEQIARIARQHYLFTDGCLKEQPVS